MKLSYCVGVCGLAFAGNIAMAGSTSSVGPASPAAVLCVDLQGELETLADKVGNQYGICAFDGARISDWTLFYSLKGVGHQQAVTAFLTHPPFDSSGNRNGSVALPNPSSQYCLQVGGENFPLFSSEGEWGMCRFSDGSFIDGWTLFLGPNVHQRLAAVLTLTPN